MKRSRGAKAFYKPPQVIFRAFARQGKGFSLVELLVAIVIGLLVTLGASQIFVAINRVEGRADASSERQESLRYLYDSLAFDVRNARAVSYDSDTFELILRYYEYVGDSDNICAGSTDGFTKIYHYQDGDDGEGVYVNVICSQDVTQPGLGNELLVSDDVVSSMEFSFLPGLYGVKATIGFSDPSGVLPDETISVYIANRNVQGGGWVE